MKPKRQFWIAGMLLLLIMVSACSGTNPENGPARTLVPVTNPAPADTPTPTVTASPAQTPRATITATSTISPTATITHWLKPSDSPGQGQLIYDTISRDTAPEKRAPYGDSYAINRFERPFLRDMTYVPDLDIASFNFSKDDHWYYVSIELVGNDPNNVLGIHYGVELDLDHDGFGDYIIWGNPPYYPQWTTEGVQVFQDKNHDTGGLSANRSDAPFTGDGYETLIFDSGKGDSPDLAWVRINAGEHATVQFAFEQSLAGKSFMVGVVADAGLADVRKYDYNDRFNSQEAGSPIRSNVYYPLGALYAFDNVCRTAIGFKPTGYEDQLCPLNGPPPTKRPSKPGPTSPVVAPPSPYP